MRRIYRSIRTPLCLRTSSYTGHRLWPSSIKKQFRATKPRSLASMCFLSKKFLARPAKHPPTLMKSISSLNTRLTKNYSTTAITTSACSKPSSSAKSKPYSAKMLAGSISQRSWQASPQSSNSRAESRTAPWIIRREISHLTARHRTRKRCKCGRTKKASSRIARRRYKLSVSINQSVPSNPISLRKNHLRKQAVAKTMAQAHTATRIVAWSSHSPPASRSTKNSEKSFFCKISMLASSQA